MLEGTTHRIDGALLIDYMDSEVRVGQFEINVRDIRARNFDVDISSQEWTDVERDVVIRGQILESGRDEFDTFDPVSVEDVPDSFTIGDTIEMGVAGELTIWGATARVRFDLELSLDAEDRISGFASTRIRWDDFGITIPYGAAGAPCCGGLVVIS